MPSYCQIYLGRRDNRVLFSVFNFYILILHDAHKSSFIRPCPLIHPAAFDAISSAHLVNECERINLSVCVRRRHGQ